LEKITITNPYGDSLTFTQGASGYMLISRGDLGGTQIINTQETGYQQRGSTVIQKRYGTRVLNLTLGIKAVSENDFKNRLKQIQRLFEAEYTDRDDLSTFTVKFESTGYQSKVTQCFLRETPTLSNKREDRRGFYQRMFVSLLMFEPVWKDENNTEILLESIVNTFEFAVDITDSFEFGSLQEEGLTITNNGDMSSSLIIEFNGVATNPLIENVTYGESLKLNTTIADGSVVTINTNYNNPTIEIDGVNAFQYIDPNNSDLNMLLRRGDNLIKFSTDDTDPATAIVKYKKTYLTPLGDY
jgi:hypothetical protein